MGIARKRAVHNADRYFTIAVDKYDGHCIKGRLFHGEDSKGICFDGMIGMLLNMDQIFDAMGCPLQTFQMRMFPGTKRPVIISEICDRTESLSSLSTFCIYVKYRYNATWQGTVKWLEKERTEPFESVLQLIMIMNQALKGHIFEAQESEPLSSCHVAIDSYGSGCVRGRLLNLQYERVVQYDLPEDLATALGNFIEINAVDLEPCQKDLDYGRLIANETLAMCRREGKKASFSIRILFRKHNTWQGIIYWREARVQQRFRSFKEMLIMIASAIETSEEDMVEGNNQWELAIGS